MSKEINEFLNKRSEFINLLDKDINKHEEIYVEIEKKLKSLESLKENIKNLSKQPERQALIPLCKRLYMPGIIIHTGEYLIHKKVHPNSYNILKTADQTIEGIDKEINEHNKVLENTTFALNQLKDRKNLLLGEQIEKFSSKDENIKAKTSSNEIRSDKGVAVKVGEFYEILEYEENA